MSADDLFQVLLLDSRDGRMWILESIKITGIYLWNKNIFYKSGHGRINFIQLKQMRKNFFLAFLLATALLSHTALAGGLTSDCGQSGCSQPAPPAPDCSQPAPAPDCNYPGTGPLPVPLPPVPVCAGPLSNKFTLEFDWAARNGRTFQTCQGDVIFNNVILFSILPTDYAIHHASVVVTVNVGDNILQFEGTGPSDSYGLTIDNVKLTRFVTLENIVVNGDFSSPNVGGSWGIFSNVNGWEGSGIQIGAGYIYNSWPTQVCELDGNNNYQITQRFSFDSNYAIVTSAFPPCATPIPGQTCPYTLEFDWAARVGSSLATAQGNVLFNNRVIKSIIPADYLIHHEKLQVTIVVGSNVLQFDAAGASDSYGLTFDNVKLTASPSSPNLIVNGNFQLPNVGSGWNIFAGSIPGWTGAAIEVGAGNIYNGAWGASQVAELDSNNNQRYTQVVFISQQQYVSNMILCQTAQSFANIQLQISQATSNAIATINHVQNQISTQINLQICLLQGEFTDYIHNLYGYLQCQVNNLVAQQQVIINQYSCSNVDWIRYYGQSQESDFTCDGFDESNTHKKTGHIKGIHGKVMHCEDDDGNVYNLQVSPCTHFEGGRPLPQVGDRIFWKGRQCDDVIYVHVATTCDCN